MILEVRERRLREEEKEQQEKSRPGKPFPWKKVVIALLLLGLVAAGWFFFKEELQERVKGFLGESTHGEGHRHVEHLREFVVNPADPGGRRFLKLDIYVAFDQDELRQEIEEREKEINTEIITLLRSKTVDDYQEPGGTEKLRRELVERLNQILEKGKIKEVYFEEFVFQ